MNNYEVHKDELRPMGATVSTALSVTLRSCCPAKSMADQATNWMACNRCISLSVANYQIGLSAAILEVLIPLRGCATSQSYSFI
jgi:hypothetical protein